ncbi:glutamate synthase large subunit [Caulobacter segnis]|uniref:Glutamate synthase [NADPH] large chain n=2 Tax=Caulobacter segnis TaxID=88688 RepID=D5VPT0_CAUST|nr:glutamate synthase large subunit [Caulobacter segnis]ADG12503.1 Glutamate synthase (ferredoxin) [Caulobacter segnis ATCC 21756]AVQ04082.1 glutamate synthase large subunit [Caulobacter segnis]
MTAMDLYLKNRQALIDGHAYDPSTERDACGVGLVCAIDGQPRREVVELAIKALKALWHRGAVDADGKTGDGAGVLVSVPQDFFVDQVRRTGHALRQGPIAVGQVFLPRTDLGAQELCRTIVEAEALRFGFYIYGWRQVPVDTSVIGEKANATRPEIEQIMLAAPAGLEGEALERALFLCRKRIEKRVHAQNVTDFYICSFSAKSLIYKGMFLAEHIDEFYPDLKDERFAAAVAIFHQRYSTNTFPQWRLAQPFRMLAHNGEINTIKGNINWMKSHEIKMAAQAFGEFGDDVKPVIQPGASDSANLDNTFEVLVRAGRDAPMAKALLVPEAANPKMKESHKALYSYCNAVMEPWDGPAALCATDGRWVVAGKDRSGLRPLRVAYTDDGLVIMGSEAGMCGVEESRITRKLAISPGRMIAIDLAEGRLYGEDEIIDELAGRHPYTEWLGNMVDLEKEIGPGPEPRKFGREELTRRQAAAGYSLEDLEMVLAPMVEEGKEAVGSMGDDTPLAVLSEKYRPLSHYFRQNFSQVTNPPIDPLRETGVMSLKTRFKNLGNILAQDAAQADVYVLESPVLTTGMYERVHTLLGEKNVAVIDCTMPLPAAEARAGDALRANLDRIRAEAEDAVLRGCGAIVLTDEASDAERVALPIILATGGVHAHLVAKGLRSYVSIIVRSAECLDTHYFAVLVGVGATAVNAYLAQESFQDRLERGLIGDKSLRDVCINFKTAIEGGLLKIISKMGISVISSYRGGYNFEAVGLSRALAAEFFPGMPSRISGIGLAGIESKAVELHRKAWGTPAVTLPVGGLYKARRSGEAHAFEARLMHTLQTACDTGDYELYRRWSNGLRTQKPIQLRDLLDWRSDRNPISTDDVESVNEIRKRFVTPGMSLGALSPEAHGALNIAMNRIGARSVSGEGGEDSARYKPLPNGDNPNSAIKQVASGRFGVTAEYLNQCVELEIKVAQGAKPGEGGQLPGFKVTEMIARLRHSTPGVMLISPPPHHDIYSIEDLAQLIYDLKQINPIARVTVKLVAATGIGAIAAGVAKAKADVILVAGGVGGTGASPQTSVKYAGGPWEMGLSEANQVLTLNNLRHSVVLRADGGMRTGRDIVIAAMMGAEEFGIGTASLVAMGCIMVRQCHSNTCPVGVCTQDEALRAKFTGTPDKVINLFTFVAEEVREILAGLGFRSLQEIVGRTDLLAQVSRGGEHLDDLDLNPLLVRADPGANKPYCTVEGRNAVPDTLDAQIVRDAAPLLERGEKMQLTYTVRSTARTIGTRTSSHIVRKFGMKGLPSGHLTVQLKGSAGQSLGAFAVQGLRIELTGEANDYVGKGLSGATIVIKPARGLAAPETNTLIGNTVLFGATSGRLFAAGQAGERFAVRNSGAVTVVEGCGANGCEYMTGGQVVILGPTGNNFGAGMTGGMAFVLDQHDRFQSNINPDSILVQRLASPYWEGVLRSLIAEHARETDSVFAATLLRDWDRVRDQFWQVCPKEMVNRLPQPLAAEEAVHERA